MAFFYDVEGEYYIRGFKKERTINKGLMIKLYLPGCELSEILKTLEYVFQYLNIERYLILTDLVDGRTLLKNVYDETNFLKDYNPLQNLIWMDGVKSWENQKLFNESFEYIYPKLIFKKE